MILLAYLVLNVWISFMKVYEAALVNLALASVTDSCEWLIPLHSALSSTEQGRAFSRPPSRSIDTVNGKGMP